MNGDLGSWLVHPVTLALLGSGAIALFWVIEIVLRSLAEMGNVQFQGVLDDHPSLLSFGEETHLHLSQLLDALRWVQVACLGVLWLILFRIPGIGFVAVLTLCIALPVVVMFVSRVLVGGVAEKTVARLLRLVRLPVWPLLLLIAKVGSTPRVPVSEEEEEEASEREIQAYLDVGQAAGILEAEEGKFVQSLVEFFDTTVREVMTPRTEMVAVAENATFDELLETVATTLKSRVPIYRDTVDHVVGVIHVKNVVKQLMAGRRPPLSELTHDCLVVPENKQLGALLHDFQAEHQQLAIVVDEYGGTSGLVTLEDILEEIVGEIQDEHDPTQPPEWQEIGDGVYRLQGRAPIELLKELFQVEVPANEVDTVGGLVFSAHGTVPEPGTQVTDDPRGLNFVVDEMDGRRIVSVTVRKVATQPAETNNE